MDAMNLLKMTLAHAICDDMDCEDCKQCFNVEECPCNEFDHDTRVSFVKALIDRLNLGPVDLGDLEDMKVEDLLKVIDEAMINREEDNVDEPAMLDNRPVQGIWDENPGQPVPTIDYIEMPF